MFSCRKDDQMNRLVAVVFLCGFIFSLHAKAPFAHGNPCATHQHILYEMAMRTKGPIIEFGCGYYSTPMLHEICKKSGRILISLDDDVEWLQKFTDKYRNDGYDESNSGWHKFFLVPNKDTTDSNSCRHWDKLWDDFEPLREIRFDICFIDQAPFEARLGTLLRLKEISRYIIVHDCDDLPMRGLCGTTLVQTTHNCLGEYDFSDVIKYFQVYAPLKPWPLCNGPCTLLGSEFESDLPEIDPQNYTWY